jgi:hypothetical protein
VLRQRRNDLGGGGLEVGEMLRYQPLHAERAARIGLFGFLTDLGFRRLRRLILPWYG